MSGEPLPTRGRPGPPLDPAADWAAFRRALPPLLRGVEAGVADGMAAGSAPEEAEGRRADADWLLARLPEAPPEPPDAERAREWARRLAAACPALAQKLPWEEPRTGAAAGRAGFAHFARWLAAAAGAPALIALADELRHKPLGHYDTYPASCWEVATDFGLRAGIVALPEAGYAAVRDAFAALPAATVGRQIAARLAFLLADDLGPPHGLQAAAILAGVPAARVPGDSTRWLLPLIADAPPSAAAGLRALKDVDVQLRFGLLKAAEGAATLVAVARAAGEPAAPSLLWLMRDAVGPDRTAVALAALDTREEGALRCLLPFADEKLVRDAFDAAERLDPAWTFGQCLLASTNAGGASASLAARIARTIDRVGADAARDLARGAGPRATAALEKLLAARDVALAPPKDWPAPLADPPWRRKGRGAIADAPALELVPIPTPLVQPLRPEDVGRDRSTQSLYSLAIVGGAAELAAFVAEAETVVRYDNMVLPPRAEPLPATDASAEEVAGWIVRRLDAAGDTLSGALYFAYHELLWGAAWQPEPLALALWGMTRRLAETSVSWHGVVPVMLARFGERALPGLLAFVASDPAEFLPRVAEVDAAGIAPLAAAALMRVKKARDPAAAWLLAHPRTATIRLLPDVLGPAGPARDAAEHVLCWLAEAAPEGRALRDEAIAAYAALDPRVPAAVAAGLDRDPLERVPARVAKVPAWAVPSALPRPRLRSGAALPDEAVLRVVEMLSFSTPLAVYGGVALLRDACTADSLDAFALDLCAAWAAAGCHHASEWALRAMGWLGGDGCARDLARRARAWAAENAKPRALVALDVLASVGTDVALTNLDAIARKNPFKQLRDRAEALVEAVAEARGLTAEEMADRVAPDLGLDARGGLDLDFGPRRFRVGFDELLRPWVRDADGQRLKLLPRPNKLDDRERAKAAAARWAGLKKDAEATADLQVSRLEAMLAAQRRVARPVFRRFFAEHPLLRHLAGRLVWGVYDGEGGAVAPRGAFRVAEDLVLVDVDDAPVDLPADAAPGEAGPRVGLVHPLHLAGGALKRWAALFGDYEIAQPFPQLGREVFRLTEAEAAGAEITRFAGVTVAGRRLRGMRPQGWPHDMDGESVHALRRDLVLADGTAIGAALGFSPGFWHAPSDAGDAPQVLDTLWLHDGDGRLGATARRFGELDAVAASEMLRGPSLLAAAGAGP